MLPEFWRFRVVNNADTTFTYNNDARIEVHVTPWKMTSGAMAQGTIISDTDDLLTTGESIAPGAIVEGAIHDNTGSLFIGFTGTFYGKADVSGTDDRLDLYIEFSVDNSRWPTDANDFQDGSDEVTHLIKLGSLDFSTDADDEEMMINIQF